MENKNEGDTTESKLARFLDNITDDDYDVVKQQLTGDANTTFDTAVSRIRTREQELEDPVNSKRKKVKGSLKKENKNRTMTRIHQEGIRSREFQISYSGK